MSDALSQSSSPGWRRAASSLCALPALAAAAGLGLGGDARFWILSALLWVGIFGVLALRGLPPLGTARLAIGQGIAGLLLALALGAWHAAAGGSGPRVPELLRTLAYDVDASVPLGPRPACEGPAGVRRVVAEPAAHPVFDPDDGLLWFEAPGPDGRDQIHRVSLEGGEPRCWTCGEPGGNRHPSPDPVGPGLAFESDRDGRPGIHVIETREREGKVPPSRRVTPGQGYHQWPLYDPSGRGLVWSQRVDGRVQVVHAGLATGHGGLVLGLVRTLVAGGLAWVAPLAWAPDARSLVYGRGPRPGVLEATRLDPATGEEEPLGRLAGPDSVAFSADGRMMALVRSATAPAAPPWLGFLLARLPLRSPAAPIATSLWIGEPGALLSEVEGWRPPGPIVSVGLDATGRLLALGVASPAGGRVVLVRRRCNAAGEPRSASLSSADGGAAGHP